MSEKTQAVQSASQALEARQVQYLAFGTESKKIEITLGMVRKYIAAPAYARDTKEQIQISDTESIQFMMLLQARRLDPWDGDAYAVPFWDSKAGCHKWALITAHHAFLKRAEFSPHFDGMESGVIVEVDGEYKELPGDFVPDTLDGSKTKLAGAWAKVVRKDRSIPTYRRAKLSTFQKDFGNWVKDPAGMIVKCAEADALRSAFPSACGGLYIREEMGPAIDVDAQLTTPAPERRPDFGQQKQVTQGGQPPVRKTEKLPPRDARTQRDIDKMAQDAPKPAPATSSQPPAEASAGTEPAPERPANAPNPETGTEPAEQGNVVPLTEPEPPQEAAEDPFAATEQPPAEPEPTPYTPNPKISAEANEVCRLAHEAGLTPENVMVWARAKKISTAPSQKLEELATQKLVNIAKQWGAIAPAIKEANKGK